MDISHLSFLRQFRGISERVSGGGKSFEPRVSGFPAGVAQCLSALAAFPETANSFTLTASADGLKRYPDNSVSSTLKHDGSAVS